MLSLILNFRFQFPFHFFNSINPSENNAKITVDSERHALTTSIYCTLKPMSSALVVLEDEKLHPRLLWFLKMKKLAIELIDQI